VETILKASRENVKMKTPEGEVKVAVLGDSPGTEEYLQHLNAFQRMISRKKLDDKMTKWTKAVKNCSSPSKETQEDPEGNRDRGPDDQQDTSLGGGGRRAQEGPSP